MNSLLSTKELSQNIEQVGRKALNLVKLEELGLDVPRFLVIPTDIVSKLQLFDDSALENIAKEIIDRLSSESYAIRSAALIEDSDEKSFAGQFKTELRAKKENLEQAIVNIIKDFYSKKRKKGELSIIVQEFIEPDYAGVTFTRNPNGFGEMLIEYTSGQGEKLVSGEIIPKQIKITGSRSIDNVPLPNIQKAYEDFQSIEKSLSFPQDIEWCIKNGSWYFLQSRPITSITNEEYLVVKNIQESLSEERKFLYKKNEVSEVIPRPSTLMIDLLKLIYSTDGPVDRVYKKYGISYTPKDMFRIFGNELYADTELELQTLLPSFEIDDSLNEHLAIKRGLITSLVNIIKIASININQELINKLSVSLTKKFNMMTTDNNIKAMVSDYLKEYEIIFEINFLSAIAIKKLKQLIRNNSLGLNPYLALDNKNLLQELQKKINIDKENLVGNSLDLLDTTEFCKTQSGKRSEKAWLQEYTDLKETVITSIASTAKQFIDLREIVRWYTVKITSMLRKTLTDLANENNFIEHSNIFFAKLEELAAPLSEERCSTRRKQYEQFNEICLPTIICSSNYKANISSGVSVLAEGNATGIVTTIDKLSSEKGNILLTQTLSPSLTKHLDQITGIITEHGGVLSHMAIIAREQNIPVIVMDKQEAEKLLSKKVVISTGDRNVIKISP